jgi:dipeptidyl aminopeptidase/acylaminoacyl peptidase
VTKLSTPNSWNALTMAFGVRRLLTATALLNGLFGTAHSDTTDHPLGIASRAVEAYADGLRKWTPRDSVQYQSFSNEVLFSPDDSKFFYTRWRGDIACDCTVYELVVFRTADVARALSKREQMTVEPLRKIVRQSIGHEFGISGARWEEDSKTISFLGPDEKGIQQYYELNVATGVVTALTNWEHKVAQVTRDRDTIIGTLEIPASKPAPKYPVYALNREAVRKALVPYGNVRLATFVTRRGEAPWELKYGEAKIGLGPAYSPDGRYALAVRVVKEVPTSWSNYDRIRTRFTEFSDKPEFLQFVLIDLIERTARPVFDAPSGLSTTAGANISFAVGVGALWAKGGRHAVLVNTALPLDRSPANREMAYIVAYDVEADRWTPLEPVEVRVGSETRKVARVSWVKEGTDLLVEHEIAGKPAGGTLYSLKNDRWVANSASPGAKTSPTQSVATTRPIAVRVQQSANEPPHVVATNGQRTLTLSPSDEILNGLWWAPSHPVQWREPSGKVMTGGLMLPRGIELADYPEGGATVKPANLPLVIHAFIYEPDRFRPDGPYRHVYAAQSLVARGMAALTITIPVMERPPVPQSPRELREFSDRIESAVESLATRGLIDPRKVGIIGFSRGGFNAYYAITHPRKIPLAAAVIDDAFPGSYTYSLLQAAITGHAGGSPQLYGGSFWTSKNAWLEHETSFNVDQVKTPALFTIHHQSQISLVAETVAAFALNEKPSEFLVFPNAQHFLHTPQQRLASIEATVDWMSFWLMGIPPAERERAARWEAMRASWDSAQVMD